MAISLSADRHFLVEYVEKPALMNMTTSNIYPEYYGIGFIVSGDRQISTPERTFYVYKGYISPVNINMYHRTSAISGAPYSRYGIRFTPDKCRRSIEALGIETFESVMSVASYQLPSDIQETVTGIFQEMLAEYNRYDKHSEMLLEGILASSVVLHFSSKILLLLNANRIKNLCQGDKNFVEYEYF